MFLLTLSHRLVICFLKFSFLSTVTPTGFEVSEFSSMQVVKTLHLCQDLTENDIYLDELDKLCH